MGPFRTFGGSDFFNKMGFRASKGSLTIRGKSWMVNTVEPPLRTASNQSLDEGSSIIFYFYLAATIYFPEGGRLIGVKLYNCQLPHICKREHFIWEGSSVFVCQAWGVSFYNLAQLVKDTLPLGVWKLACSKFNLLNKVNPAFQFYHWVNIQTWANMSEIIEWQITTHQCYAKTPHIWSDVITALSWRHGVDSFRL